MDHEPSQPQSTCLTVTAAGSEDVHLALVQGDADRPDSTLCDRRVVPVPLTRHFQEAGCCACARISLERGIDFARETAQVVVNLRRYYDRASRADALGTGVLPA